METNRGGHRPHYGTRIAEGEFGEFAATLYLKLRALFLRRKLDRDLDDELQFHLAIRGRSEPAARHPFGNVTRIREECRDLWTFIWLETLWQDIRYAGRQLSRGPGFTASAVVTLALGIGATTAVYTMLAVVLWRPVPLLDTASLVFVYLAAPGHEMPYTPAAIGDIEEIGRRARTIDDLSWWQIARHSVVDSGGEPLVVPSARVSTNLFDMLRVKPALGRAFHPDEDQPGRERVAILSDNLWRRHFGGDSGIVGRTIRIDSENYTVIGVMAPDFRFPASFRDLWLPLALTPQGRVSHSDGTAESAGRLRPGRTLKQAVAEVNGIAQRLEAEYPATNRKRRFTVMSFHRYWGGDLVPVFAGLMLGSSLVVLLIACVNVANLQFARATGRSREVAVRAALGSGRLRLVRQLLTESVMLASLGAGAALVLAKVLLAVLKSGIPLEMRQYMAGWEDIGLNPRAFAFAAAAALASGIVAGLSPALRCLQIDLTESLKEGGNWCSAGKQKSRWRSILVAGQIAMATALLTGSVLMVRGFHSLASRGASLRPAEVLTMRLSLTGGGYQESYRVAVFYNELLARAAALPGVRSVAAASGLPYSRRYPEGHFSIEGRESRPGEEPSATLEAVTPDYFRTLSVPLHSGRFLGFKDGPDAPAVAVISTRAAQRWWPGQDPIGRRVRVGDRPWSTIVGVVGDIPYTALSRELSPAIYFPFAQAPDREMDIGLRIAGDPMKVAPALQAIVRLLDPELPINNLNTMDTLFSQESFALTFLAGLMGLSGLLALVLSVVGVYGVMAYSISARTHEIGIRMALGAGRERIIAMLFRKGLGTVLAGMGLGLLPAWGLARLMQTVIWGVHAADPAAFAGVPLFLLAGAMLAIGIPAVRATRIDPVRALHHE